MTTHNIPATGDWVTGTTADGRLVTVKTIKYYAGVGVVGMTLDGNVESVPSETAVIIETATPVGVVA